MHDLTMLYLAADERLLRLSPQAHGRTQFAKVTSIFLCFFFFFFFDHMHAMNGSSSHSSNSSSSDQTAVGNRTNDAAATSSSSFRHAHPAHWQHRESLKMLGFHHPTHVSFYDPKHDVLLHWNSRKHRKGRLPVAKPAANTSSTPRWTKKKSFPRLFGLDLQDISWHVGMLFLVGSLWWCANGVMAFNFYTVSTNAIANAEAATAFLGGSWFLIGSYLSESAYVFVRWILLVVS